MNPINNDYWVVLLVLLGATLPLTRRNGSCSTSGVNGSICSDVASGPVVGLGPAVVVVVCLRTPRTIMIVVPP